MNLIDAFKNNMPSKLSKIIKELNKVIGHENWFISGSTAVFGLSKANDIDVFFYSEKDLQLALENLQKHQNMFYYIRRSEYAHTFMLHSNNFPVQFIKKTTGSLDTVFSTFDLNLCKQAIYPDGKKYTHFSAGIPLKIVNINKDTFFRYYKYLNKLELSPKQYNPLIKKVIDTYITDDSIVKEYYNGKTSIFPVNQLLYNQFSYVNNEISLYLTEQAKKYSPELLI